MSFRRGCLALWRSPALKASSGTEINRAWWFPTRKASTARVDLLAATAGAPESSLR